MIAAHISPAFLATTFHPGIDLGVAALCCYANDFVHVALSLLRIERWRRDEPYSHALTTSVGLTLGTMLVTYLVTHDLRISMAYGLCTASHWGFDLISKYALPLGWHGMQVKGLHLARRHRIPLMRFEWILLLGSAALALTTGRGDVIAIILLCGLCAATPLYYRTSPEEHR